MGMRYERRSTDPNDERNWALDCSFSQCGRRFTPTETVQQLADHWNEHLLGPLPDKTDQPRRVRALAERQSFEVDKPVLSLIWIGVGQSPRGRPTFMQ